jgi:uncharacterized membrane protein
MQHNGETMNDSPERISLATRIRNNFLTGLIICAPVAITIWLTWSFIDWADSCVKPYIPSRYNPRAISSSPFPDSAC